jgi:2-alkyl-3-oxoalkanoate reductase
VRVAVIGAGGFVGSRLVERWLDADGIEPVPVVRHAGSLARVARFDVGWRLADSRSETELARALEGCEAAVQCMVADGASIVAAVAPLMRAARAAGLRRVVYLSSAAVHGLDPAPDTSEQTPLPGGQGVDYNDARVSAEMRLNDLSRNGGPGVVVLRPSIVYGPRSRWISDPFEALIESRAGWVGSGAGFCNALYVDNLAHAIECALHAGSGVEGRAYLLRDAEVVTWRDFLLPLAAAAGLGPEAFAELPPVSPQAVVHRPGILGRLRELLLRTGVNRRVPGRVKAAVKGAVSGWSGSPSGRGGAEVDLPTLPNEVKLLHQCRWSLPIGAARSELGYKPPVAFSKGMEHSVAWLEWAGYPVASRK